MGLGSQPVHFSVGCIRPAHKCPLQLVLLPFSEVVHNPKTQLIDSLLGLLINTQMRMPRMKSADLWVLHAHELHVTECLSEPDLSHAVISERGKSVNKLLLSRASSGNRSLWWSMNFFFSSQWWLQCSQCQIKCNANKLKEIKSSSTCLLLGLRGFVP